MLITLQEDINNLLYFYYNTLGCLSDKDLDLVLDDLDKLYYKIKKQLDKIKEEEYINTNKNKT